MEPVVAILKIGLYLAFAACAAGVCLALNIVLTVGRNATRLVGFLLISLHHLIRGAEPWSILLVVLGTLVALATLLLEVEDRQTERRFRAWRVVQNYEDLMSQRGRDDTIQASLSGDLKDALQYLNRTFSGFLCDAHPLSVPRPWTSVRWYSKLLTGNEGRSCLFPPKERVLLSGLKATGALLPGIDLRGARLESADLSGGSFYRAKLSGASLFNTKFRGGEFIGADFSETCLLAADFSKAVLVEADFSDAYLVGAKFNDAVLTEAIFDGAYIVDDAIVTALRELTEDDEGKGLFSGILRRFKISFARAAVEASDFRERCGRLLSLTRAKYSKYDATGVFGRYVTSRIANNIAGVSFKGATGLKVGQLDKIACRGTVDKLLQPFLGENEEYPPSGLPTTIKWRRGVECH